jgi:hypothetical protein
VLKINGQMAAPTNVTRDSNAVMSVTSSMALGAATEGYYYDSAAKIVWVKFHLDSTVATSVSLM